MKKTLTILALLFSVVVFGQSIKIAEYTTTHITGTDIKNVEEFSSRFEIYTDKIVMTITEPEAVKHFKDNNIPVKNEFDVEVKLVDDNMFGKTYSYSDGEGEIILRVRKSNPSTTIRVSENGVTDEKNFITIPESNTL